MKTRLFLVLAMLAFAGCSTFQKRAGEKSAVFAGLDAATQENLRKGVVELGYTKDMVYIALGQPDERKEKVAKDGKDETWIYQAYSTEYRGTATVGYRRWATYDPVRKVLWTYYEPVTQDIYRDHIEDRIRITFHGDKVSVIEQVKQP
jgi:hypothetical protein